MNFYISNSKSLAKKSALLILLVFLFWNIVLDGMLKIYVDRKTNKNSFIEEKISKSKHMKLQEHARNLDIVFIGSSRTIYHISTEQFERKGMHVYNFGVSDRGLADYPFMVKEAMALNPKMIVISVEVSALYKGAIGNFKQLTWEDLKYVLRFEPLSKWGKAIKEYVLGKHLLFQHAEPMNIRISHFYHQFDPKDDKIKHGISGKADQDHRSERKKLEADCSIFDYNYPGPHKVVAKCTNGDGVLFGSTLSDVNRTETFKKLDETYVAWINTLFDQIKAEGVTPVLVLEPVRAQHYRYDVKMIKKRIHATVIDLTKVSIEDQYWADNKHVNVKGRAIYTEMLTKKLSEIMDVKTRGKE